MPTQNSFSIKQNTPEADKLERRVHQELKEIWDPTADATVAKYLTAMLAKGYDRKKIHAQLKAILQESVTVQLLDWLYKHLRLHGTEYQSKKVPASSKPAPKPPPSAAKVVPTDEVGLSLEDLEAQPLEGSDLEDDDTAPSPTCMAVEGAGTSNRTDAVQPQQRDRGRAGQEGPSEQAGEAAQASHASNKVGIGAQASERPDRSERRHREPIPIPNFMEHTRSRAPGSAAGTAPSAEQPPGTHSVAAAGAALQCAAAPDQPPHPSGKQLPKQQQAEEQQPQPRAAAGDRRRLKSSVVLDWESWHKQKQPADEQREQRAAKGLAEPGKSTVLERAPILPRSVQDPADRPSHVSTSQREQEDIRERERAHDREGERGAGPGRRRQPHESETERQGSRHRDEDGEASARRGHERDRDGGGRRKGKDLTHRSRSRSRSPRGRRSGRAHLVTANLLRSALDGLAGAPGSRGSKASVFERLGASGAATDVAAARVPARQRVSGLDKVDKAMDALGSGRKRGPEDEADAVAAMLGSPPKTARGLAAQKLSPVPRSTGAPGGAELAPAPAPKASPATGRQRVEFAPAKAAAGAVRQPSESEKRDSEAVITAGGPGTSEQGPQSKQAAMTEAFPVIGVTGLVDPQAAELEALRQQMAAMQEKLARMEAAKELSPQPQTQPQAPQSQPQAVSQPPQSQPLQQPQLQLLSQPPPQAQAQLQPERQLNPHLQPPLRPQSQQQAQVRPQSLPVPQAAFEAPPQHQHQQQQEVNSQQQLSIAARLQVPRGPVPPAAVMGVQPAGGVPTGSGARGAGAGGAGTVTIMPTSMSGVVIEGGSGSPPRKTPTHQPELTLKAGTQRLAAAQLDADLRSVVVTNVHFLANQEVLRAHFSVVGPVKAVTIMRDKLTGRSTGTAVVEMATEQATQAAAALSGSLLMDLPIVVTLKAALMLQGMNLAGIGIDTPGIVMPPPMAPVGAAAASIVPGPRLNPAAAPFVPGLTALASADVRPGGGTPGAMGPPIRPPLGVVGSAGRQPWPKLGAGGRGRGSNVWVREPARPGSAVGSNAGKRD